jgi:hypothetical protein
LGGGIQQKGFGKGSADSNHANSVVRKHNEAKKVAELGRDTGK